jgi:hypothetical protein
MTSILKSQRFARERETALAAKFEPDSIGLAG